MRSNGPLPQVRRGRWGWWCLLVTSPSPFLSPLVSLLTNPLHLPISILSSSQMCWELAVCIRIGLWLKNGQEKVARLSRFDHIRTYVRSFNSAYLCQRRSIFHRPPKIVNILLNTIHTHRNYYIFSFRTNTHREGCYAQVTFQRTKN